jgi:hypothetical protein
LGSPGVAIKDLIGTVPDLPRESREGLKRAADGSLLVSSDDDYRLFWSFWPPRRPLPDEAFHDDLDHTISDTQKSRNKMLFFDPAEAGEKCSATRENRSKAARFCLSKLVDMIMASRNAYCFFVLRLNYQILRRRIAILSRKGGE